MPPRLPARPLTLDDVTELAAADGCYRYELDEGILLIAPPSDVEHAVIVTRMLSWFVEHGHTVGDVLTNVGVKIRERTTGRCPDLVVLGAEVPDDTVWIDPAALLLVVEVVAEGTEKLDRVVKPIDYASTGIRQYWRVERDGEPTVHMHRLGTDERGTPAYVDHEEVLLDKLLDGEPPELA